MLLVCLYPDFCRYSDTDRGIRGHKNQEKAAVLLHIRKIRHGQLDDYKSETPMRILSLSLAGLHITRREFQGELGAHGAKTIQQTRSTYALRLRSRVVHGNSFLHWSLSRLFCFRIGCPRLEHSRMISFLCVLRKCASSIAAYFGCDGRLGTTIAVSSRDAVLRLLFFPQSVRLFHTERSDWERATAPRSLDRPLYFPPYAHRHTHTRTQIARSLEEAA